MRFAFQRREVSQPLSPPEPDIHRAGQCLVLNTNVPFRHFLTRSKICTIFLYLPEITLYSHSRHKVRTFFYLIPVKEMLSSIYRALSVWEAGKTSVCQKCVLENAACTCKLQKSAGAGAAYPPSRPWTVSEDLGTQAPQSSWKQTPLKPDMHPVWGLCRLDPCLDTFTYAKPWLYQFQHSQTWVNQLPSNHAAWFTC